MISGLNRRKYLKNGNGPNAHNYGFGQELCSLQYNDPGHPGAPLSKKTFPCMAVNIVLPEQEEPPFQFTQKAINQLRKYQKLLNVKAPTVLRVGTKKKGANFEYVIGFDEKQVSDYLYRIDGDIEVVVNRSEIAHLKALQIDYKETPNQKGFIFREKKPNT